MGATKSKPGRLVVADGVTEIATNAYTGRKDLREVWLPDSVVKIGYDAFYGCTGLVVLHLPAALQSIGDYAFYGCTGIVELHLPARVCLVVWCMHTSAAGARYGMVGVHESAP